MYSHAMTTKIIIHWRSILCSGSGCECDCKADEYLAEADGYLAEADEYLAVPRYGAVDPAVALQFTDDCPLSVNS